MTENKDFVTECKHTWMIDSPNGPTSSGVCTECGETGEFKNSIPVTGWDRSSVQKRAVKSSS